MKHVIALMVVVLLAGADAASASHIGVGLGAFGGYCAAVAQDDAGSGFIYGFRAPIRLIHLLTIEPFYQSASLSDVEEDFGGVTTTIPGYDMTAFGANAIIGSLGGAGITFYPYVGLGSYDLEQSGGTSDTETGWSFGLGLGLPPISKFTIQIRAELDMLVEDSSSRKFGQINAGLNYNFGH